MIKVKICGITNLEDAEVAVEAGADYLGFILYPPSKRAVDADTVREIVATLRRQRERCPVLVGVFVNETAVKMAAVLDSANLDLAQLSGDEVPSLIGDESSAIYGRSYKAIRPTSYTEAEMDAEWFVSPVDREQYSVVSGQYSVVAPSVLIDAYHPNLYGGTGETSDWAISAKLAQNLPGLMLAGGLNPDNVSLAVEQVRPYAVDVASGVEASPGKKDHDKVRRFIQNAKQ